MHKMDDDLGVALFQEGTKDVTPVVCFTIYAMNYGDGDKHCCV